MKNNNSIILLLLSVGLFYTFTNVQYQEVKELRALSSEYSGILENANAIVSLRDNLLVTYETMPKAEIDRMNKILPNNIDTMRLALDLDGIASRYGVSLKSIQTTLGSGGGQSVILTENASAHDRATVSFSFISTYENFKNIIADVEKNLRIMDVKNISFTVGESNLYEFKVAAETYWLK